ncbi:MAG: hypothetical protein ACJ746_19900 [Bryobacteraceae bacterium]
MEAAGEGFLLLGIVEFFFRRRLVDFFSRPSKGERMYADFQGFLAAARETLERAEPKPLEIQMQLNEIERRLAPFELQFRLDQVERRLKRIEAGIYNDAGARSEWEIEQRAEHEKTLEQLKKDPRIRQAIDHLDALNKQQPLERGIDEKTSDTP